MDNRKLSTLQRTRLLHAKISSPVKIKNPVCSSFIMIAERSTSFISMKSIIFFKATFYGLKYASPDGPFIVYSVLYSFQVRLYPSRVHPSRRSSSILKSLRRAEVTNRYDIINNTPTTPIIFMPNSCSDLTPRRWPPPACSSGRSGSP